MSDHVSDHVSGGRMHLFRSPYGALRALGLLVAGVAATAAVWVAASPPATSTVAPGAAGLP